MGGEKKDEVRTGGFYDSEGNPIDTSGMTAEEIVALYTGTGGGT